jgi:hypothetical protein
MDPVGRPVSNFESPRCVPPEVPRNSRQRPPATEHDHCSRPGASRGQRSGNGLVMRRSTPLGVQLACNYDRSDGVSHGHMATVDPRLGTHPERASDRSSKLATPTGARRVAVAQGVPHPCHNGRSVGVTKRDRSGHSRRGSALLRKGGQGRSRTVDVPLFSSTALPELPSNAVAARRASSDAGSRWRHVLLDLSLDHAGLQTGSRSSQRVFRVPGASQGTSCSDARSACHQPRSAAVARGTASMAATAGQRCCGTMRRSRCYGVNSFQCPSETTSTFPSVTLMAV